ncbi:MAG: fibronectin type III domain-containing protein [Candidatus Aegiribacteria sp.]|nr:fibronectin type III domain-containing protein [Candidatus Aegiribacteria sp.]
MKKLGLIVLVAGIILMAGCAGDDPSGPTGDLPNVSNVAIGSASAGKTVVLTWDAITGTDIDGYKVYFKTDGEGTGNEIADVTTNTYTHDASSAGTYVVKAYKGDNYSEGDSNVATTMPYFIDADYTIWNNHAPDTTHSGILFEDDGATTGSAMGTFDQDLYCYNGGDNCYTWMYSGDYGTFGNGSHTDMYNRANASYAYPDDDAWVYGKIEVVGDVIFAELSNGHYIKIYIKALPHFPGGTDNAWGITLYYDYQLIQGLYLFSTDSN